MSLSLEGDVVRLHGSCGLADAEPLLVALQAAPGRRIDLAEAVHLHTALLQIFLAFRPPLAVPPADPFLARWVTPLFAGQ